MSRAVLKTVKAGVTLAAYVAAACAWPAFMGARERRQADRQAIAGALRAQARELDAKSIGAWSLRPIDYLSTCQMPAPNVWPGAALRLKESVPAGSDIAILREIRLAWDSLLFRRWLPGRGKV